MLLDNHSHANTHNRAGFTPLHYAAAAKLGVSRDMCRMLLEHDADPHAMTNFGHTALERAAMAGCHDAVSLLSTWHGTEKRSLKKKAPKKKRGKKV